MTGSSQKPDFGWRLRGQTVSLLKDRSFELDPAFAPIGSFLRHCKDVKTLESCLQCGACTASCNLAEEGSLFPRREMTLVQMGLKDRLLADPAIWYCYNCNDCSNRCPSKARPGRIMAALRQLAVEHFAFPAFLGRAVNEARLLPLVYGVPALLLGTAIALFGDFSPEGELRFAHMFPHMALNLFFMGFSLLSAMALAVGANRAWRSWQNDALWSVVPRHLVVALRAALAEIADHRDFADCDAHKPRKWAHLGLFYGFMGLLALAGVVAVLLLFGVPYPFPALHPLKILGNVFAALLVGGSVFFLAERAVESARGESSSFFDWAFLANILLVGLTGLATEGLRFAQIAVFAYPVYFVHLVTVFVLIIFLPYSKFAHAGYRTLAIASKHYAQLLAREEDQGQALAG